MIKTALLSFFLFLFYIKGYTQNLISKRIDSISAYVELRRAPGRTVLIPINNYTRRMKSLRRFSITSICVGGAALGGGIYLVTNSPNPAFGQIDDKGLGEVGIAVGSLAITGGITGLLIANSRLHKLENKLTLHVSTRGGKIIYRL